MTALERGQAVVTGSRRLARELALSFADTQSAKRAVWERPQIASWQEWTRDLWKMLAWRVGTAQPLRLLTGAKKRLVWEQVITTAMGSARLLQPHGLARAAIEASDLAIQWNIPREQIAAWASEDTQKFLEWRRQFELICEREQWLDESRLPDALAERLDGCALQVLPERILLCGFDELTPQQKRLMDVVARCGTSVEYHMPATRGAKIRKHRTADPEAELVTAARWSRERLQQDPSSSIGVVVPDLGTRHAMVSRIFADILEPGAAELRPHSDAALYSVSASAALGANPMIEAALDLLGLAAGEPSWSQVSHLLRSPFLGGAQQESDSRALLDAELRSRGGVRWTLDWLQGALADADTVGSNVACPDLAGRISKALLIRREWPARQSSRQWVISLSDWLDALGWPGDRSLDSHEYQVQQRWRELLEEVAGFDEALGAVSLGLMCALLRNTADAAPFKPESARAPVLVTGILEAAGLEFDSLWVCGMHDGAWPPAPEPTPFLPFALQRSLGIPRGSADRELTFARLQLERLKGSARDVHFSWPAAADDEALRESPLIGDVEAGEAFGHISRVAVGRARAIFVERPQLEYQGDGSAPACPEHGQPGGGARILELQSNCPFRAFAELRLGAKKLEQPSAGLDPRQRGQLAHEALDLLWRKLGNSAALNDLDGDAEAELIRRSISRAEGRLRLSNNPLVAESLAIERTRLAVLLHELLAIERQRATFSIRSSEKRSEVELGGLRLRVRPDRIDELAAGQFVIDYKTGRVSPSAWFGSRPRQPQLPLYAVALGLPQVQGVAFVQLRAGEVRYAGVSGNPEGLPHGVKFPSRDQLGKQGTQDWQGVLHSWRSNLEVQARAFLAGDSRVDPLKDACAHCHLAAVCRVEEKKRSGEVSAND